MPAPCTPALPGRRVARNAEDEATAHGQPGSSSEIHSFPPPRLPSANTAFCPNSSDLRVAHASDAELVHPSALLNSSNSPRSQSDWVDSPEASRQLSNGSIRLKASTSRVLSHSMLPMSTASTPTLNPALSSRIQCLPNERGQLTDSYGYVDDISRNTLGPLVATLSQNIRSAGLTLVWRDLAVQGTNVGAKYASDIFSVLLAPLSLRKLFSTQSLSMPDMLQPCSGIVRPGESLLVLGRPESGCSLFLKALASYLDGDRAVRGEIRYSYFHAKDIQGAFRGEVAYVGEDDVHFPSLTVEQTLNFVNAARAPGRHARPNLGATREDTSRKTYAAVLRKALASALGLEHTFHTKVGDAVIRGVSGGEKKRVSLYEGMALMARVLLLDNPTRGLDSKTATEVTEVLHTVARASNAVVAAAMYQAGEPIFTQFDRLCLLNSGRVVYMGPAKLAVKYVASMGFEQLPHQSSADFLVSVTDPLARKIRKGYEAVVPRTPAAMMKHWNNSNLCAQTIAEADAFLTSLGPVRSDQNIAGTNTLTAMLNDRRAKNASRNSPFITTWGQQIRICLHRRYLMQIGDLATHVTILIAMIAQGLIFGSVMYQIPHDTHGFFSRASALFFMLLFTSFMAHTEIMIGYAQRPIIIRHKKFGIARPSADSLANSFLDVVFRFPPLSVFVVTMYFLCGLGATTSQFFIALGITFLLTEICVGIDRLLAAMFRDMDNAGTVAGLCVIDFALYAGYAIPTPFMVSWWSWLRWWNPMNMAQEMLMANEFRTLTATCTQLVPAGGSYETTPLAYRACNAPGVPPGTDKVKGSDYIKLVYGFDWAHRWWLTGLMLGFWIGSVVAYAIACEFQKDPSTSTGVLLYSRKTKELKSLAEAMDTENDKDNSIKIPLEAQHSGFPSAWKQPSDDCEHQYGRVFSFQDVCYDVVVKGETRRLLHGITGFVPTGQLTAIMGPSGSGKTTLMNVLAQRTKDIGVISGTFLCGGRPLPLDFLQETGYCEQMDTHLSTATVREALQFSALLRQSTGSRSEKLAWCEEVIDLLDMGQWANALVGKAGEDQGLGPEQRKRLTIGVELAAKPKLLLFLDEPTSGLDTLAARSIVRLLKRLASAGQSILCTIHQPSGELLAEFDRLLLLDGGKVVFNGPLHIPKLSCGAVLDYFQMHSQRMCGEGNPTEFIMDCIASPPAEKIDWATLYEHSHMVHAVQERLGSIHGQSAAGMGDTDLPVPKEYAASQPVQLYQLLLRTWTHFWRSPTYLCSKFALNLIAGLFVGSSFYGWGTKSSPSDLPIRVFAHFVANVLGVPLAQHMMPTYVELRAVFETRERRAKIYSWYAFQATFLAVEVPWDWICGLAYWAPWEFMVGNSGSHLWSLLWFIPLYCTFWPTFAVLTQNMAPDALLGGVFFEALYSFCLMFSGIVTPPSLFPKFWLWMNHLTPLRYYMEGQAGNALESQPVTCSPLDLVRIMPPPDMTCDSYLADFSPTLDAARLALSNHTVPPGFGYWVPMEGGICGWCTYTHADQYLAELGMDARHRVRDVWIFVLYLVFNVGLCFATYYFFRIFSLRALVARGGERKP